MNEITINPERKMSKSEAEAHEKAIILSIGDIGMRLLKIRDEAGWAALGFESFKEYASALDEKIGSPRTVYRLIGQAEVNHNLTTALKRDVHLPVAHALAIKYLEPEEQVEAFKEATRGYKKGDPKPTEKIFQRAAQKVAPDAKKKSVIRPEGWSEAELKADEKAATALGEIRKVYGKDNTAAIQNGLVAMKRGDVLFLAKLPVEKMREIQTLIFVNRWRPQMAVRFLNTQPDDNSTVEELKHLCLATKVGYWEGDFRGFKIIVELNRKD